MDSFVNEVERITTLMENNPKLFPQVEDSEIRKALVKPHHNIIYKIKAEVIEILTFWDTRQNPEKLKL